MLLILIFSFNQIAYSKTYERNFKFMEFGYFPSFEGYDDVHLTIDAGVALMMVEWPDATLTINIPSAGVNDLKINKQARVSLFTFANSANINIDFKSKLSLFYFPSPYLSTLKGASIFATNMKSSELNLDHVQQDIYMAIYGLYNIKTSLEELSSGKYEFRVYVQESEDRKIWENYLNGFLNNVQFVSILKNKGSAVLNGKLTFESQYPCNPTVPTTVLLNYLSIINTNKNNFKKNIAYGGGVKNDVIELDLAQMSKNQFILISNELSKPDTFRLSIRYPDGTIESLESYKNYYINRTSEFSVELYMNSDECYSRSYVKTIQSSPYTDENGSPILKRITDDDVLSFCKIPNGIANVIMIVVFVVVIVALIIAIIVIVVVFKKKLKQQNGPSPENQSMLNSSL